MGKVNSQNQNNIWYFGDHAGLDFNSGSPVSLVNGQINTPEGSASISDNNGNLLFYTDGITIWNKNHIQMPNGSGLLGNLSTTQAALIVPKPSSSSLYYLFVIDQLGGAMTYSIVDMTLQAGNGDVTSTKNVMLHPSASEKQTAIQKCDGNIWLISHEWNSNNFFADLIVPSGINPSVNSSIGTVHQGGSQPFYNTVGYLKASQQGNRLALALRDANLYEVFDFDITTGIVSNPITLSSTNYNTAYGVEFSPDGTKLYGSTLLGYNVYQFNLMAVSPAAIAASAMQIASTSGLGAALQSAPNGKIYVAQSYSQTSGVPYLGVINSPNILGSNCNYVNNGITLGGRTSMLGLPNFMISPISAFNLSISGNTTVCSGQSTKLTATGALAYSWTGGTTSSSATINVSPLIKSTYYVTGTNVCGSAIDSVTVSALPITKAQFTYQNSDCDPVVSFVNLSQATSQIYWNFGDGTNSSIPNPSHTYLPGVYTALMVVNPNTSCADSIQQTINSTANALQKINIPDIFTPNNDGINDEFEIAGLNMCEDYHLEIYNRWGQKIFETKTPEITYWNGTNGDKNKIVEGMYYYILTSSQKSITPFKGAVTLIK